MPTLPERLRRAAHYVGLDATRRALFIDAAVALEGAEQAAQPQERKPLPEIDCLMALEHTAVNDYGYTVAQRVALVRAVEAAHGIKE